MSARIIQRRSRSALWSRHLALFGAQLLILAVLLHQLGGLTTPPAVNLVLVAIAAAAAAFLIAIIALVRIWIKGDVGAGRANVGITIALATLALPLYYAPKLFLLPHLTDISTDVESRPDFVALASARPQDANALTLVREDSGLEQEIAYPDIRTMELERPATEVFDLVSQVVRRLEWKVAVAEPPGNAGVGRIEASNRTPVMGFTDDISIRVSGDDAHATVDVRSASRYGLHDFGANADRIRLLFTEVKADLAKGETTGLEELAGETKPKQGVVPPKKVSKGKKQNPKAAAAKPEEAAPAASPPRSDRARRSRSRLERRQRAAQERARRRRERDFFEHFGRW